MDGIDSLHIQPDGSGTLLAVKVVAGSSRDRVAGVLGDALKVTTSAPAEKGKANAAVAATLAAALGLDRRNVRLAAGATRPRKSFRLAGLTPEALRRRLAEL